MRLTLFAGVVFPLPGSAGHPAVPAQSIRSRLNALIFCCGVAAAFWLSASRVDAQDVNASPPTQVVVGLSVPLAFNDHPTCCDTPYGALDATFGVWGEIVKSPSPRVAFHTGVEFPKPYSANVTHESSAGFISTLRHRDIVAYELIGIHSHSPARVKPVGLVGVGVVFSHTVDHRQNQLCCTGIPYGPVMVSSRFQMDPSILGGLDLSVRLNAKIEMIIRAAGRITFRRDNLSIDDGTFRRFALVPGVGLSFHANP
jgi:hypothetical protein